MRQPIEQFIWRSFQTSFIGVCLNAIYWRPLKRYLLSFVRLGAISCGHLAAPLPPD